MATDRDDQPVESHHSRHHRLALILVAGGGLSLILYAHGVSWWYGPLAALAIILAHVVVVGGVVLVGTRVIGGKNAAAGTGSSHDGDGHAHGSTLIRRPRMYDVLVRVITLGREGSLRRRMLDLAELRPGDSILDVGCGTGTLLLAAAARVGPSGRLHGIEPAGEMIAHARSKAKARGLSIDIVKGSADSLPYPASTFDAVFCTLALHHVSPALRTDAVREMRRVLRPGGRIVVADLQRPRSIAAALSVVSLLHHFGSHAHALGVLDIEPQLVDLGFASVTRHSLGSGAIGAVAGRLGAGAHPPPQPLFTGTAPAR